MTVSPKYLLDQRECLQALARMAFKAATQRLTSGQSSSSVPGPMVRVVLPPRSKDLVKTYLKHVGGSHRAYRGTLPPHLFPQWAFGLAARVLEGIDYPLLKVLNAGCSYTVNRPLPANEPLEVSAQLTSIEDNGQRALITVELVTETASAPRALIAEMKSYVPLSKGPSSKARSDRPRVPADARELMVQRIGKDAGRDFAFLTGDINPLHWIPAYARAAGFRNPILHGFGTLARAVEGLNRSLWSGRIDGMSSVSVRFTRPLVLPKRVGLFLSEDDTFYIGDAPSGPAYLVGRFERAAHGE